MVQLRASDANGRMLIAVTVQGKINGTFYLWGTPRVRTGGSILDFPDIQLATESRQYGMTGPLS